MDIVQSPHSENAYFYHRPSCDTDQLAIRQFGWFGIWTLIGIVRVFTGTKWQPTEIGWMIHDAPSVSVLEQFPETRVITSQPYSYIALNKTLFSLPPLRHEAAAPASSPLHFESFSSDFIGSLKQVFLTYIHESDLSITRAAEVNNMSKCTLQRKLAQAGTSFSILSFDSDELDNTSTRSIGWFW